ncbi:MAG: hypothetical protein ACLRTD_24835 [Bacteroides sp.]
MGRCLSFLIIRVTELRAFEELAGELLDEVMESVCRDAGRSVFRWWYRLGVEYLVRKGLWKMMIMKGAIRLMKSDGV